MTAIIRAILLLPVAAGFSSSLFPRAVRVSAQTSTSGRQQTLLRLFAAMRAVESRGDDRAVGDGGKARGPLQFHRATWNGAIAGTDARLWSWEREVWDYDKACYVAYLHWERVCPAAVRMMDVEMLARCHRLPNDPWRLSNDVYWARVLAAMKGTSDGR